MSVIRNLKAHTNLLMKVIKDQAGTLEKSILEAVMNSIEAGSPSVAISLKTDASCSSGASLIIEDQGKGFCSEKEIHEWFEMFGQPHTNEENKIWAKFRMGRGQCFAFGKNIWRTGQFEMIVDVDNMGLEYELKTGLPHFNGCRIEIELYTNPIGTYYRSIDTLKTAIKRQIEFMGGLTTFNGEALNVPAEKLKWDIETDDAYFMFGRGVDLAFYNLGAFVMSDSASIAGVTGVVVSKQQLKVNFARNDIQQDCPIYGRIRDVIKQNRVKKARKQRRSFSSDERNALLIDLRDGDISFDDIRGLSLLELSNGNLISFDKMRQTRQFWAFSSYGNQIADRLSYSDRAICLNEEMLDRLGFPENREPIEFFDWLFKNDVKFDKSKWLPVKKFYRSFHNDDNSGLADGISESKTIIPNDKWTKVEKRLVKALESYGCWKGRAIGIGSSEIALAWTDGETYIILTREYIRDINPSGLTGASHLIMTMFHELSHNYSTIDTHEHTFEFYRNFHNLVSGENRSCSPAYILAEFPQKLRNLRQEDWHEKVINKEKKAIAARNKALRVDSVLLEMIS